VKQEHMVAEHRKHSFSVQTEKKTKTSK